MAVGNICLGIGTLIKVRQRLVFFELLEERCGPTDVSVKVPVPELVRGEPRGRNRTGIAQATLLSLKGNWLYDENS
jgi:hypothetical protein